MQAPGFLQNPPSLNPLAAFGRRYPYNIEDEEAFQLTSGEPNTKRAFSVFQDPEPSPGNDRYFRDINN
jgi:hypothetical protein